MAFIRYLPLTILLFFLLKFLISYIEKSTISLNNKINSNSIKNGLISIKDIQKNNYNRFISIIESYLNSKGFKNINFLPNGESKLTNLTTTLDNEKIYISCIQSDSFSEEPFIEGKVNIIDLKTTEEFIGRLILNNYTKGILITNNSFSNSCIDFINHLNTSNSYNIEVKLIDGYELTKFVRSYNNYLRKEGISYDN
ncbi:restriction endonuclease [Clostridioides difficile]